MLTKSQLSQHMAPIPTLIHEVSSAEDIYKGHVSNPAHSDGMCKPAVCHSEASNCLKYTEKDYSEDEPCVQRQPKTSFEV